MTQPRIRTIQEDRNLADSISIIMVKDNLIKLIDYINDKLDYGYRKLSLKIS